MQAKRRIRRLMTESNLPQTPALPSTAEHHDEMFNDTLSRSNLDQYPGVYGLCSMNDGLKNHGYFARIAAKANSNFGAMTSLERHEFFYAFTRAGFREAMRTGRQVDGSELQPVGRNKFKDKYGIVRSEDGPFWPADYGPLHATPVHRKDSPGVTEPLTPATTG